jgi:hypothetical protein
MIPTQGLRLWARSLPPYGLAEWKALLAEALRAQAANGSLLRCHDAALRSLGPAWARFALFTPNTGGPG